MKLRLLAPVLLLATAALAAAAPPAYLELKTLLTPAEWQRAGLDKLTPDQIGVIDAALIRLQRSSATPTAADLAAAQPAPAQLPAAAQRTLLQRFGLPSFDDTDWRSLPPLQARATKWESANRFLLDNGQVWEGVEPIAYELVGKPVEIRARPHGQFALAVDGQNTTLRVIRLR